MRNIFNTLAGVMVALFIVSCGDEVKEMPSGGMDTGAGMPETMPEGHPTVPNSALDDIAKSGHPVMASTKEVKVSDQTKKTWKEVKVEVTDSKTNKTAIHVIKMGSSVTVAEGVTVKAEAFLPDYTIFDEYIGSKSEEPNNPAALLKLSEGGTVKTSGWIFKRFTDFDSFRNDRFKVVLLTPEDK